VASFTCNGAIFSISKKLFVSIVFGFLSTSDVTTNGIHTNTKNKYFTKYIYGENRIFGKTIIVTIKFDIIIVSCAAHNNGHHVTKNVQARRASKNIYHLLSGARGRYVQAPPESY
jgi:hypothetical protein